MREALLRLEHLAAPSPSIHGDPEAVDGVYGRDGRVIVCGERQSGLERGSQRTDSRRVLGPLEDVTVPISPVEHVPDEERGANTELGPRRRSPSS